jgi:hydroxyacylglutathione hydrolase
MLFRQIVDPRLAQYAYLIGCQRTKEALLIDPERDIERYVDIAAAEGMTITAVAETHIHADFLSGCREFAHRTGVRVYLPGEAPPDWRYGWTAPYDVTFLADGDTFAIGQIEIRAIHSPGHTPEHISFLVTDRGAGATGPMGLATGDFVFVGDLGRPDLLETAAGVTGAMEPAARALYRSAVDFLDLPDYLQVWPGHGAGSACGKALGAVPETTVGYERRYSPAFAAVGEGESGFVDFILSGQPEPPPYFARMKELNRDGPPILGSIPVPDRNAIEDMAEHAAGDDATVLDLRIERPAFMGGHLTGSIHAPLNKSFPTIVGSYADPGKPVYLIVAEDGVRDAVLSMIRIGYDRIEGWASPDDLGAWAAEGGAMSVTEIIDNEEMERRRVADAVHILDVRAAAEFATGHVPHAINIAHTRLGLRVDELPSDRPVAVHCGGGGRAASAVSLIEKAGRNAVLVDDDFAKWIAAHSHDVETGVPV